MEEGQPIQTNKYLTFIRDNKYNLYFAVAIAILLFMIIFMIVFTINHKNTAPAKTTVNTIPTQAVSPTLTYTSETPSSAPVQITTPEPTEAAEIQNQTQPQIAANVAVPYTVSNITKYGDTWVTMNINNSNVGGGAVIVQKVNGSWKVVMGPGSFFPSDDLQSLGAPQGLINHFTNPPGPSESPSPSY